MDGKGNKRKRHEKARKTTAPPIVNPRSIHERDIAGLEAPHPTYDLLWSIEEPPDDLTTVQLPGINTDAVQDQLRNKNFESSELACGGLELEVKGLAERDCTNIIVRISQAATDMSEGKENAKEKAVNVCARHTWILANKNQDILINSFGASPDNPKKILSICAAVLLTLVMDLDTRPMGFFAVLLHSELVWPMPAQFRTKWEAFFKIPLAPCEKNDETLFVSEDEDGESDDRPNIDTVLRHEPCHRPIFRIAALTTREKLVHLRACEYLVRFGPVSFDSLAHLFAYRNIFELLEYHQANRRDFISVKLIKHGEAGLSVWALGPAQPVETSTSDRVFRGKVGLFTRRAAILEIVPEGKSESFPPVCPQLRAQESASAANVRDQATENNNVAIKRAHTEEVDRLKETIEGYKKGAVELHDHYKKKAAEESQKQADAKKEENADHQTRLRALEIENEMLLKLDEVSKTRIQELEYASEQAALKAAADQAKYQALVSKLSALNGP
ncbi:unnamed protein product [Zymoseptoria tritici ST99CH_1E4]|uniref:Uncharacterized protein n=1 Tax=Zymoseptoria tritici ST99CH_1E4 TaxID=1276532 RepID=A0A2H1FZ87_ZYMTR|nr:unnamed protein product [Zymoseptoria tritici ST99CH_1E4]